MQMIKLTLLWAFLAGLVLAAPSRPHLYSPLPASINHLINLDPNPCDARCLERLLSEERLFSFLARYEPTPLTRHLSDSHQRYATFFNVSMPRGEELKIALLLPTDVIGRYSAMITNSVSTYLLYQGKPFEIAVFDSQDESYHRLSESLEAIEAAGFRHVIAGLTAEGVSMVDTIASNLEIFIPTVNKEELSFFPRGNLYFGGIDYGRQLKALGEYRTHALKRTIIFDEPVHLSQRISAQAEVDYYMPPTRITINNPRINYTRLFEREGVEDNATLLLNTQPVRTSLILSQVSYNDINISSALSTQINFNPMILTLTQSHDVQKFFVASSIGPSDIYLRDMSSLLHNDMRYNWIPYATAILTNLIEQRQGGDYAHHSHHFDLPVINNQIDYTVTIYQIRGNKFVPAPPAIELFGPQHDHLFLPYLLQRPPEETP